MSAVKKIPKVPSILVESKILFIRGEKIIMDSDLALLYGVNTKALNQAVKRNQGRFPEDFLFQLTALEKNEVVTICDHLQDLKFSPVRPFAFTEHGAIMAAAVLNSEKAVNMGILVVRAFVKFRKILQSHKELSHKFDQLERKLSSHDQAITALFAAIREMVEGPTSKARPIGFRPSKPHKEFQKKTRK